MLTEDLLSWLKNDCYELPYVSKETLEKIQAVEAALKRLSAYENCLRYLNRDQLELSHEKVLWQRNDWRRLIRKVLEEHDTATD